MAFTVEDGTGTVVGANSYQDEATFTAYVTDRGRDVSGYSATDIQTALVRATDYIETRWGSRFKGYRELEDQPLSFPRLELYSARGDLLTGLPAKLLAAHAEYAYKALTDSLYLEPVVSTTGAQVIGLREKVGPIETETQYSENSGISTIKPIPMADRWLQELVHAAGSVSRA